MKHILIFEPRIEGHHIPSLVCLTEELIAAGIKVSVALDTKSPEAKWRIKDRSKELLNKINIVSLFDNSGHYKGGSKLKAAAICLEESEADEIFFNSFDEIASNMLRWASLGIYPPKSLKGKISGIYIRPRPLDKEESGLNKWVKKQGFNCLYKKGWIKRLFFLDEFILPQVKQGYPAIESNFLPDPWTGEFNLSTAEARINLNIKTKRIVLVHYGIGSKRKGLHLLLEALGKYPNHPFFLLVAGPQEDDDDIAMVTKLQSEGKALLFNRYISSPIEEKSIIGAADWVLLPYVDHYGSSNLLGKAASAGKFVLASDYHLIGKRVHEHKLGRVFANNDSESLLAQLKEIAEMESPTPNECQLKQMRSYANSCSRAAFKETIHGVYGEKKD